MASNAITATNAAPSGQAVIKRGSNAGKSPELIHTDEVKDEQTNGQSAAQDKQS